MAIGERPRYWHQYEGLHDVKRTIHVNPKRQLFRLLTLKDQKILIRILREIIFGQLKTYMNIILTTLKIGIFDFGEFSKKLWKLQKSTINIFSQKLREINGLSQISVQSVFTKFLFQVGIVDFFPNYFFKNCVKSPYWVC